VLYIVLSNDNTVSDNISPLITPGVLNEKKMAGIKFKINRFKIDISNDGNGNMRSLYSSMIGFSGVNMPKNGIRVTTIV
ncbi:hypothetical protein, partial [Escherichia coli]|uniref:hypothetical protein n=4 Tax=Escherichia coli TaxID=562 RepID=UPI001BDB7674